MMDHKTGGRFTIRSSNSDHKHPIAWIVIFEKCIFPSHCFIESIDEGISEKCFDFLNHKRWVIRSWNYCWRSRDHIIAAVSIRRIEDHKVWTVVIGEKYSSSCGVNHHSGPIIHDLLFIHSVDHESKVEPHW